MLFSNVDATPAPMQTQADSKRLDGSSIPAFALGAPT
jgi:hypothetical protein